MRVQPRQVSAKRLLLAFSLAVATTAGLSGAAHAAYQVRVSAESESQLGYGRGYNAGTYQSGAAGGPGYTSFGGTCASGVFSSCTVGGYGTMDANPDLKAAKEATSIDSTSLPSYYFPQGLHSASSSFATASLASGSVGIADSGTYGLSGCCSGQDGGHGVSYAENTDLLHFNVAGAGAGTVTVIGVSFDVHGVMNAFTPLGDSTGDLTSVLQLGGGFFQGGEFSNGSTGYAPVFSEAGQTGGWLTDSVTQKAPGEFTFNATYGLTGASQELGINEYLQASCGVGTACDYAHTATVSFTLPSNVTFTSDSGVFLSRPNAVPEPGAWALMVIGVAGVGGLLRRRRPKLIALRG